MRTTLVVAFAVASCGWAQAPQLVWEGEVDGTSILHIRGDRLDIQDVQGSPTGRERHRFFAPLPGERQDVQMRMVQGRGAVRIVSQPRPENNFTLSIRIEDPIAGRAMYSLELYWNTRSGGGWNAPQQPQRPRRNPNRGEEQMTWTGRVDNEAIVECRAGECRAAEQRGQPVSRDRYQFSQPLPAREVRVSLDNIEGRGEVALVEQPNASNNFTARVRVLDPQGGAADYAFSLFWIAPRESEPERLFARPGMTWSGRVDGLVRLQIMGTSGAVDLRSGAPVQGDRFSFTRPLPFAPAPNLAVRKVRGRGRVEIVEFPTDRNGYRVTVEIDDSAAGADLYEIELGW